MKIYDTIKNIYGTIKDIATTEASPKGLTGLLSVGVIACGAAGCATTHPHQNNYLHDYEFGDETQDNTQYKLERIILHGKEFYVQAINNKDQEKLPFIFLPFDKIERVINLSAKYPQERVKLESKEKYIPEKVKGIGTKDNYVDMLRLSEKDNKQRKIRGIQSNIKKIDTSKLCDSQFNGSSKLETEQDVPYGIRRMKIFGEEYFFPHVAEENIQEDRLNFYLVPLKGSKLRINHSNKKITLENENKIYRPLKIKKMTTSEKREVITQTPTIAEEVLAK
ncbi:MAG: hypothetical protein ABIJ14_02680 [Nanoarchaeota archaeon]